MNAKLTLTIEKSIIEKAKTYARGKGRSLSDLIENYLKIITKEDTQNNSNLAPIVKYLKGSFKAPNDFDYEKELTKGLNEKYLK